MRSVRLFMLAACAVLASAYLLLSEVRFAEIPDSPLFQASLATSKAQLVDSPNSANPNRNAAGPRRVTCELTCDFCINPTSFGTCRNTCVRTCAQASCMISCGPATCDITCRNTCQSTCNFSCSQMTCELTCLMTCSYTCSGQVFAGSFNPPPEEEESISNPADDEQE